MQPTDEDPVQHPRRLEYPDQGFVWIGDKDLKKLQKKAWDAGWWPQQKKNAIAWLAPIGGDSVLLHGTSTDHRAYKNARALFKKHGLNV